MLQTLVGHSADIACLLGTSVQGISLPPLLKPPVVSPQTPKGRFLSGNPCLATKQHSGQAGKAVLLPFHQQRAVAALLSAYFRNVDWRKSGQSVLPKTEVLRHTSFSLGTNAPSLL